MAQIDFNQLASMTNNQSSNNTSQVGYFSLKNDGDEAIVRFMHDDVSDFEILTVHSVTINGKYRKVNCLRTPNEPFDKCPLCASGNNVQNRVYVRILQYEPDETGKMVAKPKIWERSVSYAQKIKSYLDNYGPMSDIICKVIRHGKAGDLQTDYEIVPNLNKNVYRDDIYIKDNSAFSNYHAKGVVVIDRDFNDVSTFVNTGNFPMKSDNNTPVRTPSTNEGFNANSNADWNVEEPELPWSNEEHKSERGSANMGQNGTQQVQRPARFY